jgi:hypothetical protein
MQWSWHLYFLDCCLLVQGFILSIRAKMQLVFNP